MFAPSVPIEQAVIACVGKIAALGIPRLNARATPDQIESVADFLKGLCAAVDPLVELVGREVKAAGPGGRRLDLGLFRDPLFGALDGLALWEIQAAAAAAREERDAA